MNATTALDAIQRPSMPQVSAVATSADAARPGSNSELSVVSEAVCGALSTWSLPERVRRLALPSPLYNDSDLDQMTVVLVENAGKAVTIAAWEADAGRYTPTGLQSVLLHGLYVSSRWQRQGLGTGLLEHVSHWIGERGFDGMAVKVWREAEAFFRSNGFNRLRRGNDDLFPLAMWKGL